MPDLVDPGPTPTSADKHDWSKTPKLAAALVAAQKAAQAVEADGHNSYHDYKYVTAEAIMQACRTALNVAGLVMVMEGWSIDWERLYGVLDNPDADTLFRIDVAFAVIHESGESARYSISYPSVPEKGRPPDKAAATALTHSVGYFLRGLLCLPRVNPAEDPDQRDDRKWGERREEGPPRQASNKPSRAQKAEARKTGSAAPREETYGVGEIIGADRARMISETAAKRGCDRDGLVRAVKAANAGLEMDDPDWAGKPVADWPALWIPALRKIIGSMPMAQATSAAAPAKPAPAPRAAPRERPPAVHPAGQPKPVGQTTPSSAGYWHSKAWDMVASKLSPGSTDADVQGALRLIIDEHPKDFPVAEFLDARKAMDHWRLLCAWVDTGVVSVHDGRDVAEVAIMGSTT